MKILSDREECVSEYKEATFKTTRKPKTTNMPIHNKNSLLLSFGGGVLMILAGVSGAIGVIGELSEALQYFFGLEFFNTFENFMEGLAMWAGLGGFVAILGGLILTTEKVRFGRMVILAGITVGVVGLLMTLVQMASTGTFVMGMMEQLQQSLGWIGAIMAYIGRIIAEQKPMLDPE
ncbi:MAG: hypothetical protein ACW98U_04440 [Candidatus Thorarchaeota archaeon]